MPFRFTSSEKKILAVGLLLVLFLGVLRFTQPELTGYLVYEQTSASWTFDTPGDYVYDSSLIDVSNGQVKLKLINATASISNTTQIGIPEGENDYSFESAVYSYNGALKNIYFDADVPGGAKVKFKIKADEVEADLNKAKWYGPTSKNDWYEASGATINSIHPDSGYLQYKVSLEADNSNEPVLKNVTITYEIEEYSASAQIETQDLTVADVSSWGNLITTEVLNGQAIDYQYSVDSGSNWNSVSNNDLSPAAVANEKIRMRAQLNSDKVQTSVLSEIEINYSYISCSESWQAKYTACGIDDTRVKYYDDGNSCGTSDGLPSDNGTVESCDYCSPTWENINSSCKVDDVKDVAYYYSNTCCGDTGLASDCTAPVNSTASCDYCTSSWSCSSYGECQSDGQKQCNSTVETSNCYAATNLASDNYAGDYSELSAACDYDAAAPVISEVIAEPETTETEEQEAEASEGSGGASEEKIEEERVEVVVESSEAAEVEVTIEAGEKVECSYAVKIDLPESLALTEGDVSATITNTGTCDIDVLELEVTGEASRFMGVSPSRIEGLAVETTASFSLIKIDEPIAPLQGLIVVEPGRRAYSGELKIQGITGNVIEVEESIEINVEIGGGENRIADLSKFGFVIFLVLTAISVLIFMKRKRGKNENLETRAFVPADRGE